MCVFVCPKLLRVFWLLCDGVVCTYLLYIHCAQIAHGSQKYARKRTFKFLKWTKMHDLKHTKKKRPTWDTYIPFSLYFSVKFETNSTKIISNFIFFDFSFTNKHTDTIKKMICDFSFCLFSISFLLDFVYTVQCATLSLCLTLLIAWVQSRFERLFVLFAFVFYLWICCCCVFLNIIQSMRLSLLAGCCCCCFSFLLNEMQHERLFWISYGS